MTPQDICQTKGTGTGGTTGAAGRPARRERAAARRGDGGGADGDGRLDLDRIGGNGRLGIQRHRGNRRLDGRHDGRRRMSGAGRNDRLRRCDRRNERVADGRRRARRYRWQRGHRRVDRGRRRQRRSRRRGRHRRSAGAAGRGGSGGTGGSGGAPSCSVAVGGRPAPVAPPSLARCVEYSQNDPGATCNTTTNANNPLVYDLAVSPDGQYLATAGSHRTSSPNTIDSANDRVRIWRLVGNTPTLCGSINISNPGLGPAYVAFSPNGQYLAVAWRRDYVYVYSVPDFTMVGSILSSVRSALRRRLLARQPDRVQHRLRLVAGGRHAVRRSRERRSGQRSRSWASIPTSSRCRPSRAPATRRRSPLAAIDGTAGVYVFDGTTISAPTIVSTGPSAAAWAARFNPAGNLLAIGTDEGFVHFWNIPLTSTTPTGNPIDVGLLDGHGAVVLAARNVRGRGVRLRDGYLQRVDARLRVARQRRSTTSTRFRSQRRAAR